MKYWRFNYDFEDEELSYIRGREFEDQSKIIEDLKNNQFLALQDWFNEGGGGPPVFEVEEDGGPSPIKDFVVGMPVIIITKDGLPSEVEYILERDCYRYSMVSIKHKYWGNIPKNSYPALDYERAVVDRSYVGTVSSVLRTSLVRQNIGSADIFSLSGGKAERMVLICSDNFKNAYERNGCEGLVFKEVEVN